MITVKLINGKPERELTFDENKTVTSVLLNGIYAIYYQSDEPIVQYKVTKVELDYLQYQELQPTDWYFVRKVELGIDVPTEIINERLAIREKYDLLKLEI